MAQSAIRFRLGRALRACSAPLLLSLLAFSGCTEEVGGDGWVPPQPTTMGGSAGTTNGGEGGDDAPMTGGKGGSGGKAGSSSGGRGGRGGSGGRAGSGMTDAGAGGDAPSGPVCGNGTQEEGEECDDGNTKSFDGCPADCRSSCATCEQSFCKSVRALEAGDHGWPAEATRNPFDLYETCKSLPGTAITGTAQGELRSTLCKEMVDCIRRERCAQFVADDFDNYGKLQDYTFFRCFLDVDVTSKDPTFFSQLKNSASYEDDPVTNTNKRGKCYREILAASERDKNEISEVANGLYSGGRPLGVANLLLQSCDRKLCLEECFPEASAGVVAQISADILAAGNEAGESALGNLFADALRAAGGTEFALLNSSAYDTEFNAIGLLREAAPGRPADAVGRVLESEVLHVVFGMDPVSSAVNSAAGSKIVTLRMTGQQLYDALSAPPPIENTPSGALQVSGLSYTWDATLPSTTRVTEIRAAGVLIDKSATYSVTTNDKLALVLVGATDVVRTDKSPARELISYLGSIPQPVAPPALGRIIRLN